MKVVIITTEPSGDYLGYHLIKSLKKLKPNYKIYGVGGELMKSIGFRSWISMNNFNTIGIIEVLLRIFKFVKLLNFIVMKIKDINPEILITIDSPSFSYRLVKKLQILRNRKTKFIHYVAPTVWAWKSYRSKIFAKLYDQMFTLFNFEPKYFTKHNLNTRFVGHQIFFEKKKILKKKKILCFLPGSREVEIKNNLKTLKKIIKKIKIKFPEFKIYILTFTNHKKIVSDSVKGLDIAITTNFSDKQKIMEQSFLAVAASGSVTLELTKYRTPTIVVYRTNLLTQLILKVFVKVKYASIINIVNNKEIIPEFIFQDFTEQNVISEIKRIIQSELVRKKQIGYMNEFCKNMLLNNQNPSDLIVKNL